MVMIYVKEVSQHLSGGTERNDIKPNSGWLVSKLRSEHGIF